jgi:hypothetical protein
MKKRPTEKDWLPLSHAAKKPEEVPTGEAFRPAWIDFDHGIRVGNLEPHERITRILKYRLEEEYETGFVTDRWGRGVFWQWICWVPRADREAKPISSSINFGCAKFFISQDREKRIFQSGMTVERGWASGKPPFPDIRLKSDWDWNLLMKGCARGSPLDAELRRLVTREGFGITVTGAKGTVSYTGSDFSGAQQVRQTASRAPSNQWAGFSLFYPMPEKELTACSGYELVQAVMGVFSEVTPAMNLCMQVSLVSRSAGPAVDRGLLQEQGKENAHDGQPNEHQEGNRHGARR